MAIGVLMGLRGCPQDEAVNEITSDAAERGLSLGELGHALVQMASGDINSPHRADVQHRWRHLLALREYDGSHPRPARTRIARVRYGPDNDSTIC